MNVGGICANREGNIFEQDRLPRSGSGDNQSPLPASQRSNQINRSRAYTARFGILKQNAFVREKRCKLIEMLRFIPSVQRDPLYTYHLFERHKFLLFLRSTDVSSDFVSGPDPMLFQDCSRYIHIFGTRRKIVTFPPKKSVALIREFQHPLADQKQTPVRVGFEKVKNQLVPGAL